LQALVDVQNGPPLCKDELEWCGAMAEAERLLAIDPPKPKRIVKETTYLRITGF